jgi:hypothetical protein
VSWFKVDDAFHSHPKVLAAGNAAIGLWVRCGAYAAQYGTNGRVSGAIVARFGRKRDVVALQNAGLFRAIDDGSGDYQMHDFLQYNPTAEQVKRDREAAADRQARSRASRRDSRVTHGASHGVSHTTPTRPDPYYSSSVKQTITSEVPDDVVTQIEKWRTSG